jgi:hypothetical protein
MGASDGDSDGSARPTSAAQDPERGPNNPFLYLIVTRRGERHARQAGYFHEWVVMKQFYRHRVKSAAAASVGNAHQRMERLSRETRVNGHERRCSDLDRSQILNKSDATYAACPPDTEHSSATRGQWL